ncbi:hypothetical protein BGZ79_005874 [Entomortierella chlamydospora]|nr:hypothetical protein BGZ79_005874 [Entomortierella chlamydospora]
MESNQQVLSSDTTEILNPAKHGLVATANTLHQGNEQHQHENEPSNVKEHTSLSIDTTLYSRHDDKRKLEEQDVPKGNSKKRRSRWSQSPSPDTEPPSSIISLGFIPCPELDPNADDADFTPSQGIHVIELSPRTSTDSPTCEPQHEYSTAQENAAEGGNPVTSPWLSASVITRDDAHSGSEYKEDPPKSPSVVSRTCSSTLIITPQPDTSRSPSPLILETTHNNAQVFDQSGMDDLSRVQVTDAQRVTPIDDADDAHEETITRNIQDNISDFCHLLQEGGNDHIMALPPTETEMLHDFTATQRNVSPFDQYGHMDYNPSVGQEQQQQQTYPAQKDVNSTDSSVLPSHTKNMSLAHPGSDSESFKGFRDQTHSEQIIGNHSSANLYMESLLGQEIGLPMPSDSSSFTSGYLFSHELLFTETSHGSSSRHFELLGSSMRHGSLLTSVLAHGNNFQSHHEERGSLSNILVNESTSSAGSDNPGNNDSHLASSLNTSGLKKPEQISNSNSKRLEIQNQDPDPKRCDNCHTASTPSWRRCPQGRILLCNACGLYHKLHGRPRPFYKTKDGVVKIYRTVSEHLPCTVCGTRTSSVWGKGDNNEVLCNNCSASLKQFPTTPISRESGDLWSGETSGSTSNFNSAQSSSELQLSTFALEQPPSATQSSRKKSRLSKATTGSRAGDINTDDSNRSSLSQPTELTQPWQLASSSNNTSGALQPTVSYDIGGGSLLSLLDAIQEHPVSSNTSAQLDLSTNWQQVGAKSTNSGNSGGTMAFDTNYALDQSKQQPLHYWTSARGLIAQYSNSTSSSSPSTSYTLPPISLLQTSESLPSLAAQRQHHYRQQTAVATTMATAGSSYASIAQVPSTSMNLGSQKYAQAQQLHRPFRHQTQPQQFLQQHQRYSQSLKGQPSHCYQPRKLYQQQQQQQPQPQYQQHYQVPNHRQPSYRNSHPPYLYSQHLSQSHRDQYQNRHYNNQNQQRHQQQQQQHHPASSSPAHSHEIEQQSYFQEFTNPNYDVAYQAYNNNENESTSQPPLTKPVEAPSTVCGEGSSSTYMNDKPLFNNTINSSGSSEFLDKPSSKVDGGDAQKGYEVVSAVATQHLQIVESQNESSEGGIQLTDSDLKKDVQEQQENQNGPNETSSKHDLKKKLIRQRLRQYRHDQNQAEMLPQPTREGGDDSCNNSINDGKGMDFPIESIMKLGSQQETSASQFLETAQRPEEEKEDESGSNGDGGIACSLAKETPQRSAVLRRSERRRATSRQLD